MAFNGAGVFNRLYSWATDKTNAILVRADRMDAEMDGIATGLSNAICKDGQTTITANIPLNSYQLTGVGNGTTAQAAATVSQVQAGAFAWNATAGGTADAINVTVSPTPGSYVAGMTIHTVPASNNTGTATLNVNGLGVKTIKVGTANLSAGDILANVPAAFIYDGTNFQMHSPSRGSLGNLSLPIPLASGGTGATTAAAARAALGTLFSNYSELGGNVTVNASYRGASLLFNATATVTFDTAANLTANFAMAVFAGAGATVTLDANGTETIDGQLTQTVSANSSAIIASTGNATAGLRLAGSSGSSGGVTETITAGEALTINATNGLAVVYKDTFNQRGGGAGKVYLVDADATGPVRVSGEIGIITANISNGDTGNGYFRAATITGLASLTAGGTVWAHNGTAGAITQSEIAIPANNTQAASIKLGTALNTTAITFAPPGEIVFAKYIESFANNSTTTVEHFTDDGAATRQPLAYITAGGTVAISNGTGTNLAVGYTGGGGANAAFDSNDTQSAAQAATAGSGWSGYTNYVGKDYGANTTKTATRFRARAASDNGFVNSIAANWAFQGSADNTSFNNITTGASTGATNETLDISNFSNTSRAFRLVFEGNGVNGGSIAELTLYETSGSRQEPIAINGESLADTAKHFSVRHDDGNGSNATNQTTFRNRTSGAVNATLEVVL